MDNQFPQLLSEAKELVTKLESKMKDWDEVNSLLMKVNLELDLYHLESAKFVRASETVSEEVSYTSADDSIKLSFLKGKSDVLSKFLSHTNALLPPLWKKYDEVFDSRKVLDEEITELEKEVARVFDQLDICKNVEVDCVDDAVLLERHSLADYVFKGSDSDREKLRNKGIRSSAASRMHYEHPIKIVLAPHVLGFAIPPTFDDSRLYFT